MYRPRRIKQVTEAQKVKDESVNQSDKQIKIEGKFSPKERRDSVAQNTNILSSISSKKATYEISISTACGAKSCQEYSLPLIHNHDGSPTSSRLLLRTSESIFSQKYHSYSKSSSTSVGNINNENNLDLIKIESNNKENINMEADKQNNDIAASIQPVEKINAQCLSLYVKEYSDSTATKQILNIPESKKYTIINSNIDNNANSDVPVQSLSSQQSPPQSSQEQKENSSEDINLNENSDENAKASKQTPASLINRDSIPDQYLLSFSESFFLESSSSFPSVVQVSDKIRSERNNINSFWFSSLSNLTSVQLQSNDVNESVLLPKSTASDKSPTIVTKDMIQLCNPSSNMMRFSNHGRGIDNDNTSSNISQLSFSDSSFSESLTSPSPDIKAITSKANDILNKYKKITCLNACADK